jgi:hypothetical protein
VRDLCCSPTFGPVGRRYPNRINSKKTQSQIGGWDDGTEHNGNENAPVEDKTPIQPRMSRRPTLDVVESDRHR